MLPVPNRECIRQAVRTGMAIDAQINKWSRFDRKNYFYADLPQGYQISQLYHPLVGEGQIEIQLDEKDPEHSNKTIGIERIHVEQDAGKLMHDQHPTMSYVDLNRSGVALMEIVSRPDMRSPAEARRTLAYFPLPGVTGPTSRGAIIGASRLATPMVRLATVSGRV